MYSLAGTKDSTGNNLNVKILGSDYHPLSAVM